MSEGHTRMHTRRPTLSGAHQVAFAAKYDAVQRHRAERREARARLEAEAERTGQVAAPKQFIRLALVRRRR